MYYVLLVLLILISVLLITAVLLQAGKGGGLAASFGGASSSTDSFIGTRQAGNLLTRISWWGGGAFLFLAFILQILSTRATAPRSILEEGLAPAPAAPAQQGGTGAAPALPLEQAPAGGAAPATPAPDSTQ